jgi:predicted phosphodiesterase
MTDSLIHTSKPGRLFVFCLLAVILAGCAGSSQFSGAPDFKHEIPGEEKPWTHQEFDAEAGKFTFAVFSDLTGGERERIFEIAVAQLSILRPEFLISVGDLIEGGTDDLQELDRQWESFDDRANRGKAPLFHVGGNHDLTGKVMQDVWDQRYGQRYYHFVYKNTLFLVLDTEDNSPEKMQQIFEARNHALKVFNEEGEEAFSRTEYARMPERMTGNISEQQSRYFQQVIAANPDVRWTFLFMHKAPWERQDEQNFSAIEQALSSRPYTLFHGHLHVYKHQERRGRDYIRLATTGGTQFTSGGRSADHVTLVTVTQEGVDIANLLLEGILDKTGHIPLGGDDVCFELLVCGNTE